MPDVSRDPAADDTIMSRAVASAGHDEWLRMRRALWPDIVSGDERADAAAWLARAVHYRMALGEHDAPPSPERGSDDGHSR